jgi:hypothetical protein
MPAPAVTKFAGDIRLWRNVNGVLTPLIPNAADASGNQPVEANAMVFSREEGETIEIKSKRRGNRYGQVIHSEQEPGVASMSLTLLEVPTLILARVLFGTAAEQIAVAAGSVANAPLAITTKDRPLQLPHRMLDDAPAPVVNNGAVALVAGTDYDIDLERGQILIKAAGVAVGDADVTISYSYLAHTKIEIKGGGTPTETFYVTGDMQNRVTGDRGELTAFEWKATVDGDVDLLGDETISPTLSGSLVIPSDQDAPYTFVQYALTA